MTTLTIVSTGEVIEAMTKVEAERITAQIADKLDGIADNFELVMPLIRDALTRQAHAALGYPSVTAYVSERFAGALTRLPRPIRVEVVAELSAAGMSTRAIGPVVGASNKTVHQDRQVLPPVTPNPAPAPPSPLAAAPAWLQPQSITGLDGKTYARPTPVPQPTPEAPAARRRLPLTDSFRDATCDVTKAIGKCSRLMADDRLPQNAQKVAEANLSDLQRAQDALHGVIEQIKQSQEKSTQ